MVIPSKTFKHDFKETPLLEQINREDGSRVYRTPNGNFYPSVTHILGQLPNKGLEVWKKRVGANKAAAISKAATDRGSLLHSIAESYLKNKPLEFVNPFQKELFSKIKTTLNSIDNIKTIEKSLYSNKLRLAGTPDCIGDYGNVLSVIDFKTSTRIKEEKYIGNYFMQCGAYAIMYEELFGIRPEQSVIIIAVEESNVPQVFKKDSTECFYMLRDYVAKLNQHRRSA